MSRILLSLVLIATSFLFLTGCGGGGSSVPSPGITGEYHLVEADTRSLPAPLFDDVISDPDGDFHFKATVSTGSIELLSNGRYEHRVNGDTFINGQRNSSIRHVDRGTYRVTGNRIDFTSNLYEDRIFSGRRDGAALLIDQDILGEGKQNAFRFER